MADEAAIKLVAHTSAFNAGLASAQRTLASLKNRMDAVSSAAKLMLVGAIAKIGIATHLWNVQEEAVLGLEAALKNAGVSTDAYSKRLQNAASKIQSVSRHGDEAILAVMRLGIQMGISADRIEDAAMAAAGLADVYGISLDAAMKLVAKAQAGQYESLQELMPALKGMTTEAEKAAAVQKLLGDSWQYSQDRAKTASGAIAQMKNALGDMEELIGKAIAPAIASLVQSLNGFIMRAQAFISGNEEMVGKLLLFGTAIVGLLAAWGPLVSMAGRFATVIKLVGAVLAAVASPIGLVVAAIAAVGALLVKAASDAGLFAGVWEKAVGLVSKAAEFLKGVWDRIVDGVMYMVAFTGAAMDDWSNALRGAILSVALGVVSFVEDLKYWFTEVMPAYLGWFLRNWRQVFTDIGSFLSTVLDNMMINLMSFFSNVWKWLKGDKAEWKWTALTDGFEATLKEDLPKIAERELSKTERKLQGEIAKSFGGIFDEAQRRYEEMKKRTRDRAKADDQAAELPGGGLGQLTGTAVPEATKADGAAGSAFEDITAAFNRIAEAAAGRTAAEIAEEQLAIQKETFGGITEMVEWTTEFGPAISSLGDRIVAAVESSKPVGRFA